MIKKYFFALILTFSGLFMSCAAFAHCDTMSGPVIKAAQNALTSNNINLVLIWVYKPFEKKIRQAFQKALANRKKNQQVADKEFFETVVQYHRESEGVKFTGIKPENTELSPAIISADKAIDTNQIKDTEQLLTETTKSELETRFNKVLETKNYDVNNVEAGRKYVEAYVSFIHYVEHLYDTAKGHKADEHAE